MKVSWKTPGDFELESQRIVQSKELVVQVTLNAPKMERGRFQKGIQAPCINMNTRRNFIALSNKSVSDSDGGSRQSSASSESYGGFQEISRSPHSSSTISRQQSLENNKRGPRHKGLKSLKTTNKLFTDLLNYRFYRLNDTAKRRSARATGRVKRFGDKIELGPKDKRFDRSDGILVFDFLKSFIREAKLAAMSEAQLYLFPRIMLRTSAHDHFVAIKYCSTA